MNQKDASFEESEPTAKYSEYGDMDGASTIQYENWNLQLAKKLGAMFKTYRKFAQKYANKDPLEVVEQEFRKSQGLTEADGV